MSNNYRPSGFGGFSFFPPVIKNLLIINGVVFFLTFIMNEIRFADGLPGWYIVNRWFALNPLSGTDPAGLPYNFQIWQLITYQFLHANFSHILFNMFALWMFGMEIENIWGSKKFLFFYLMCGVVAGLVHILFAPLIGSGYAVTVGASGAIYGVLIAFAMLFPNRLIFLYFLIPVKAKYLIGFFVILDLLLINSGDNVARLAHIGGALAGVIFILLDSGTQTSFKNMFKNSSTFNSSNYGRGSGISNPFKNISNPFKKKQEDVEDATFYDITDSKDPNISQRDIDAILDKISKSGYQNLTEKEKKILFEASKKMK
ncbi:MAG: rhomboid family intramembrane serine protease [Ignavibacteriaceae bacterium]